MKKRRDISVMGLSFLDVISCGFGAIVLLLVLTKADLPKHTLYSHRNHLILMANRRLLDNSS